MKAYKIHRWDSILPPNSPNSLPMVYISADMGLIKYAQNNNYCFEVEIRCTDSVYDGHKMLGTFDSLLLGPNCGSKVMKDKNWHTISLASYFYKYPPRMGEIVITGMGAEGPKAPENNKEREAPAPPRPRRSAARAEETKLEGMNIAQISAVLLLIVASLILIIFVFNKRSH